MTPKTGQTVYELVGGEATFRALVDAFYRRVETDPVLASDLSRRPRTGEAGAVPLPDAVLLAGRTATARSEATRACGCAMRRSPSGSGSGRRGSHTCSLLWTK